ncbi:hypothetical protein I0C86_35360 [Plantactinospora sp. S1510]|uniref:Lipoprotein n=1 Tax=Plantactinospora alkalitolerans TaxID=2789879 RepID=A0ABS0H6T7_9ACTN|nr:hypothetical protein [Plantactinospora alkalitolerans]MBF9134178.1 hypothetical protein [Plantactinospora alkalitolerans]
MARTYRSAGALLAAVAVVTMTGCQLPSPGGEPEGPPGQVALRAAATATKDARTLRVSFEARQSGGTLFGGTLIGKAEVVAQRSMVVDWSYRASAGDTETAIKGQLIAVDKAVYMRSSQWKPPAGKRWFAINPNWAATPSKPIAPEWFVLVMSRLLDPLFLLDQGLPESEKVRSTPGPAGEGTGETYRTDYWYLDLDGVGPEVKGWGRQMGASVLDVVMRLTKDRHPDRLKVSSSAGVMLFDLEATFDGYGTPTEVTAPAPAEVEKR